MKDETLVKGIGFDSWRRVATVLPTLKVYNTRQVDELMVMDITATSQNRAPDYQEIRLFSSECFVPLTIGGGVASIDHIRNLLRSGADKVSLNSILFSNPDLLNEGANMFGTQCMVASIDARKNTNGSYECYGNSGKNPTGRDPVAWAQELERRGAGEILINSIECDGTMEGYDLNLISMISSSVSIPVIAAGGAGNYEHMYQALHEGKASAVAAASMFHFTQQTPLEAKKYLGSKGLRVRR